VPSIPVNSVSPPALREGWRRVPLVCPLCRGPLETEIGQAVQCVSCRKCYSVHAGIPDFRVFPDPFLSFSEDQQRTEIILEALHRYSFPELLEYYWSLSDITPEPLRKNFVRSGLLGQARAQRVLDSFEDGTFQQPVRAKRVLEIGSGTGNFLALAVRQYEQVIGIDIGMRHLHVSRRRFMDMQIPAPPLACCCGEYLPFPDGYFDLIVTSSTLEFARDQRRLLSECARTLKADGALYVQTVNRYALNVDPYAYVWGVGFLPRKWQALYVRWRRDASYENVRTFSLGELSQLAGKYFASAEIVLPKIDAAITQELPFSARLQIQAYNLFRNVPVTQAALKRVGPSWEVLLRNPAKRRDSH
jgi:ubiquinone/menaquinone biosynthesis C-methylase UbiE/uncharacterized protein YbaR (Trm112 family)